MISNLRFSANAPAYDGCSEWGHYKGNCKFLLRWFRDDFLGLLTIYVPISYLPAFSESNAWDFHLVMSEISGNVPTTSDDFRRITEDMRTLPKIKCPQMFQKKFEQFRSYLKLLKDDTFSVLWYDFVRTQERTQSQWSCVRNNLSGFVSQVLEIVLVAWERCLKSTGVRLTHNAYTIFWRYNFDWLNGWQCWTLASKNVRVEESNTRLEKRRATWNAYNSKTDKN